MTRKVREIMSAAPVCMAASESVSAAAKATPVGVVSLGDLALDKDERSALSQISASGPNS